MKYDTNDIAKLTDIYHELEPLKSFLDFYYQDKDLVSVGLGVSNKIFKQYFPEMTRKQLISLLDWFNDNLKEVEEVLTW